MPLDISNQVKIVQTHHTEFLGHFPRFSTLALGGLRRLLRGSLLGGAAAGSVMLPEGASAFASTLHTLSPSQLFNLREMGLLGWLLVDLGINWVGWAVATAFKVIPLQIFHGGGSCIVNLQPRQFHTAVQLAATPKGRRERHETRGQPLSISSSHLRPGLFNVVVLQLKQLRTPKQQ